MRLNLEIALRVIDIIDYEHPIGSLEIEFIQGLESLFSGCVPDVDFDFLVVNVQYLGQKLDSNGGLGDLAELVEDVSSSDVGLAGPC